MKLGQTFSGFQLKKEKKVQEISSVVRTFEHIKTGAQVLHVENKDDNKVFSVAFQTPSYDNTGLPHILEHSVLCGSRKFPTKDPFLELLKSSLRTFLNAVTFPDKTAYPVGSRNEKDFFNLVDVYLDAVFYPKIYEKPEIFKQEGWRYVLEEKKKDISVNGVVYNEMKGFYSMPEALLEENSIQSLYSDTSYAFNYGGNPEDIVKLKYESFLEFHKKYYHPSNSYTYVYGDVDIKKFLEFFDEEYLSNFEKREVNIDLGIQKPFKKMKRVESKYSISNDESEKSKVYFALNYSLGKDINKQERIAFQVLIYYLMSTKSAPLKKSLLDEKLGEGVFGHFEDDVLYPYLSFTLKNSSKEREKKFLEKFREILENFVKNGLDENLLKSCITFFEFNFKEADYGAYPKGLFYNFYCLKTWLYGKDPVEQLEYDKAFKKLRGLVDEGYFESLIEKYILKNNHSSLVVLEPEKGLLQKKENELQDGLNSFKDNLTEDELKELILESEKFQKYQQTPDRVEDIKKIPKLGLEDVSKKIERIATEQEVLDDVVLLHNPIDTNDIVYLNFAFDLSVVPQEKLHSFNVFSSLLGRVSTKKHSYSELDTLVQKYTGGVNFSKKAFVFKSNDADYYPKFLVSSKFFSRNCEKSFEILNEILFESRFDEKDFVKSILLEKKSKIEMQIDSRGDSLAAGRLSSYFSEVGKYNEYTGGLTYYHYLCDLVENFDSRWDVLKKDLEYFQEYLFCKKNFVVNVVSEKKDFDLLKNCLANFISNLSVNSLSSQKYSFPLSAVNEGLLSKSSVQYVASGGNFKDLGYEYSGRFEVLKNILREEYLWNMIRVQGGAYNASCGFGREGNVYFSSFRDPNLLKTLDVFNSVGSFLKDFDTDDFEKFIVGAIGALDKPLTASMKGEKTLGMYFSGISFDDLQRERDEVLGTKISDIREFSGLFDELFKKKYFCVFGNEEEVRKNSEMFGKLINVYV